MKSTKSFRTKKYPNIMSAQDGAAYLHTSRSSLSRWAAEHRNPALITVRGRYCVDAEALAEQVYPYPDQVPQYKDEEGFVDLPVLHTVSELAESMGVSDLAIYESIRGGYVYSIQIGKRYLIPDHQATNLREYIGLSDLARYGE